MRVVSHTCSNTEIVCALGRGDCLVGVDTDSDYPPQVATLPKLGRDLELDVAAVQALRPDLVLTSLTVPGHERIVEALQAAGLRTLVIDPVSLDGVHDSIRTIAGALDVPQAGERLVGKMQQAMPPVRAPSRPGVLVEWWPKPVIVPGRLSWVTDVIALAGGSNPWAGVDAKSLPLDDAQVVRAAPRAVVMSWCGVPPRNYRAAVVRRRAGWAGVPALQNGCIHAVSEAFIGRPGPRLVEGYRRLARIVADCAAE